MVEHRNDTDVATYSVAIMLGLSLFVIGPLLAALGRYAPWAEIACFAYFSSMACLLAVWLAIGNSPLVARLLLSMQPGMLLGLAFSRFGVAEFTLTALLVPLASLPSFGVRSLGYRLVRFHAKSAAHEAPTSAGPLQFTLRHLFGLTAAVAVYAFIGRMLGGRNEGDDYGAAVVVLFVVLSLSAAAAAWAALAPRKPGLRLFSVAAMTGVIALVLAMIFGPLDPEWILPFGIWGALHALMVGTELLLFREIGYRLVRTPRAENARLEVS